MESNFPEPMATHARHYSTAAPVLATKPHYPYPYLFTVTVAAVLVRLWYLTDRNIWYDEAVSISIARLPWSGLWEVVTRKEANSGLYFLLLKTWMAFSESPAWVRGLSVIFGVATIPLLYSVARRLFGNTTGLLAAVILAVNPYHIRYSQETRGYALAALLAMASTWAFIRAVEGPSRSKWAIYILLIITSTYTHFFGGLVMAAHYVSLLALPVRRWPWRSLLASALLVFAAVTPLFVFIAYRDVGQVSWIQKPGWEQIYATFFDLSGPAGVHRLGNLTPLPQNMLLRLYAVLVSIAAFFAVRAAIRSRRSFEVWPYVLLFSWMFVPILLTLAISTKKPIFLTRYLIVCLPAWALLAGLGLAKLHRRWLMVTATAFIVILSMAANARPRRNQFDPPYHEWQNATAYVMSHAQRGDGVVFYHPYAVLPFEYYRRELGYSEAAAPELVYPFRRDGLLLARNSAIDYRELWPTTRTFQRIGAHQRIWYVMPTNDDIGERVKAQLAQLFPTVHKVEGFGAISLTLYERPSSAAEGGL